MGDGTSWLIVLLGIAALAWWFTPRNKRTNQELESRVHSVAGGPEMPLRALVPADLTVPIVGTQHHSAIDYLERGAVTVRLRREPENQHDPNAIGAHVGRRKLGYVPRRLAVRLAPAIDQAGGAVTVPGFFDGQNVNVQPPAGDLIPTPPVLRPITPWGRVVNVTEVEGEFMHRPQIRAVFAGARVPITGEGAELEDVPALLVPSGDGAGYLDVLCAGHVVGYLDDRNAAAYRPVVHELAARGMALQASARIWARDGGQLGSRVSLRLPAPDEVLPPMPLPTVPFVVFPPTSTFQVTGEERHMDALGPLVATTSPAPAVATLHSTVIQRARSSVEAVQVQILGKVVGELSNVASGHVMPLVKACEAAGKVPVVQAVVTGNSLKAEVAVRVARAGEVTQEWLHGHGLAGVSTSIQKGDGR